MPRPIVRVTVQIRSDEGWQGTTLAEASFDAEPDVPTATIAQQAGDAYEHLTGLLTVKSRIAEADNETLAESQAPDLP